MVGGLAGGFQREQILAKEKPAAGSAESAELILQLTIAANQIAGCGSHVNPYETRNALLEQRRQARVRYENGKTLPAAAAKLRADAERKARHSRILSRNIERSTGVARHVEADAHHIVAAGDKRAKQSRTLLFDWGIGINDVDNGVYLPKKWSSNVPGLEESTAHEVIHTDDYHLAVEARLIDVTGETSERARLTLRDIKGEILSNAFIY
jgi:hypothetical protein